MIDFSAVQQSIQSLRHHLDELEGRVGELEAAAMATERRLTFETEVGVAEVIPASAPSLEADAAIIGGEETLDFLECCAVGDDSGFYCTGTLIAPRVVVTARHCTGVTRVFFGTQGIVADVNCLANGNLIGVSECFSHPHADLQILVLEADAPVEPIEVARDFDGGTMTATLVGFGNTDATGRYGYGRKRRVNNIKITSLDCSALADQENFGCRRGIELVAGQRGLRRDTCTGDSGGPLYVRVATGGNALLGATSRGVRSSNVCGDGGIYTRVDLFLAWIEEKTGVVIP